jgi:hypothetical protein
MTTIARRVRSTPVRTATETWALIVDLIAAGDDTIRDPLAAVGDVAAMLISEEHSANDPIILSGCGPQIRIYTLHGNAAIDGASANEAPLTITAGDAWQLSFAATDADLDLATTALANVAHVGVYDPSADDLADSARSTNINAPARTPITVNLAALEN